MRNLRKVRFFNRIINDSVDLMGLNLAKVARYTAYRLLFRTLIYIFTESFILTFARVVFQQDHQWLCWFNLAKVAGHAKYWLSVLGVIEILSWLILETFARFTLSTELSINLQNSYIDHISINNRNNVRVVLVKMICYIHWWRCWFNGFAIVQPPRHKDTKNVFES